MLARLDAPAERSLFRLERMKTNRRRNGRADAVGSVYEKRIVVGVEDEKMEDMQPTPYQLWLLLTTEALLLPRALGWDGNAWRSTCRAQEKSKQTQQLFSLKVKV